LVDFLGGFDIEGIEPFAPIFGFHQEDKLCFLQHPQVAADARATVTAGRLSEEIPHETDVLVRLVKEYLKEQLK
jgi:hypothetical protein